MMKQKLNLIIGTFALFLICVSFTAIVQDPWDVPAEYVNMENPVASDDASLKAGKTLYMKHCKSCHGTEGLGDGPKAETLDTESGDFSTEEFHSQTDGSILYKSKEGRDDMPSFKKKIASDTEYWQIVNFIRTLKE
jgi:mono/diheme cytochrome c family protein